MFGKNNGKGSSAGGPCGVLFRATLRSLQLIMALAVCGLYGSGLNDARKNHVSGDPKWMYAETIAGLSALTAIIYMIPFVKSYLAFGWDTLLFIFWVAVFGTFGKLFIGVDPKGDGGVQTMKNAVWVDLFNVWLWAISASYGAIKFFRNRNTKLLPTAQSTV